MTVRSHTLKLVGALGASALTIGALSAPALAAGHDLTYECQILGTTDATLDAGSIPATMTAGQVKKPDTTVVVHLSSDQTTIAGGLGNHVKGSLAAPAKPSKIGLDLTIPKTKIHAGDPQDITASGKGKIKPTKAGTITLKAGDVAAKLHLTGGPTGPTDADQTCTAPTDSTANLGKIVVSKDKSKTTPSGSYSATKKAASLKAKVKGATFGLAGTGKVKFTLKKGSKSVGSATGKLKKGVAKVKLKKSLKNGKYTVVAKFKGDAGLKGSSGKGTFKVG
jgi:Big-like domain-containing protein